MTKVKNRFQFELPDGWEDQTVYIFEGPESSGIEHRLMLNIDRHLQHDDINDFAHEKTDALKESVQGISILKDEETTIRDGNPAYEFVYKWIPSDEKVIFYKFVFIIKDDIGFSFSAMFSKKTLKTVGLQMGEIIESLIPGTYYPSSE
ncbi:MAG: DcrB-related protein [candidate division Zixibacteria bacterium]|nr:DcrB-related protein [candidate division Zixibacteria bacterium]